MPKRHDTCKFNRTRILGAAVALGTCWTVTACGLPDIDVRQEWATSVKRLGVAPVYPPREGIRIGQLWIGDASTTARNSGLESWHTTSLWVSDGVSEALGESKTRPYPAARRFPATTGGATDLGLPDTGTIKFKQPKDSTLELAAMPAYNLASLDQAQLAGTLPTALARFFAGFTTSRSKNLSLEALGVEIADTPISVMRRAVLSACVTPGSDFSSPEREGLDRTGYGIMAASWEGRRLGAGGSTIAPFKPQMMLVAQVYYMRGVNYIYHDDNATAAAVTAALNTRVPLDRTPSATAVPSFQTNGDKQSQTQAALKQMASDLTAMKTAIGEGNALGISASAGRVTARGIEMTHVFERPLAFGYGAYFSTPIEPDTRSGMKGELTPGIGALCDGFR